MSGVDFAIKGYKVIVTGGSRGIGRGLAEAFARQGASVSICGRDPESLAETHAMLAAIGPTHSQVCDLADGAAITAYVDAAAEAMGGLDVLVNNASAFGRADTDEGWQAAFGVDIMATMRASRAALPWLRKSRNPSYVHISSSVINKASVKAPAYGAMKAALVHYSKTQAKTLAAEGIRVNTVGPGSTTAPGHFFEERRANNDPAFLKVLETIPAGRLGTPEEIADVVMFFASPAARWVTGQTVIADGGQFLFDHT